MSEFKTPGNKTIEAYIEPSTAHVRIRLKEGGKLPEELSGVYTSMAIAELAINTYLLTNKEVQTEVAKKKEVKKEFIKDFVAEHKDD